MSQAFTQSKFLRWGFLIAQCLLGVACLWILLHSIAIEPTRLLQQLSRLAMPMLALGVACFLGAIVLGALRYHLFLPGSIPFRYLFGTTLLQNALLTFVPWRIGELSYPLFLRRDYNIPIASSSAVIIVVRLTDLAIILAFGLLSGGLHFVDWRWLAAGVFVGSAVALTAVVMVWRTRLRQLEVVQTALRTVGMLRDLRTVAQLLLTSTMIFILTTVQATFILHSVGFDIAFIDVALLNSLTLLSSLLPIHPPGGWGTVDSIQVIFLAQLGYAREITIPAILAVHILYTIIIFTGGVLGWLIRGRTRSIRHAEY